jgi:rod shape-determining protein MreD
MKKNSKKHSLLPAYFIAITMSLFGHLLFPNWQLCYFAPLIVTCYYQKAFIPCLWVSFFCGLFLDLLSSSHDFGLQALCFCLTTYLLYSSKRLFYANHLTTTAVLSALFTTLLTAIRFALLHLFDASFPLSLKWILADLIILPLYTALYGFTAFTLPIALWERRPKKRRPYTLPRPQ